MKKKADSINSHLASALPQSLIRLSLTVESATEGFPQILHKPFSFWFTGPILPLFTKKERDPLLVFRQLADHTLDYVNFRFQTSFV